MTKRKPYSPDVKGLWEVSQLTTYNAVKRGSTICGVNPLVFDMLRQQGYELVKNPPRVYYRTIGQQSAPDTPPFIDSRGVEYKRDAGFWYTPCSEQTKREVRRDDIYWRITDPRTQARLDVEYELMQGRDVPTEVLDDPWLFPPPWGSTPIVTHYREALS